MPNNKSDLSSEKFDLDYFLQDNVCRFCWSRNGIIEIYTNKTGENPSSSFTDLTNKIKFCLDIELTPSILPNKICVVCLGKLNGFYNFKIFCKETDRRLNIFLRELNTDDEDEISHTEQTNYDSINPEDIEIIEYWEQKLKEENLSNDGLENEQSETPNEMIDNDDFNSDNSNQFNVPIKNVKAILETDGQSKANSPPHCNICWTNLNANENLIKHKLEYHGFQNGFFKCYGCDKEFTSRASRGHHEKMFCVNLRDGYRCKICQKCLSSRKLYETHLLQHRLDNIIDKSSKCSSNFNTKMLLKKRVTKNDPGSFVCEVCGRVYKYRRNLAHHVWATHKTDKKSFSCTYCDFTSTLKNGLVLHLRRHTGERPYSCDECPQKCISKSNLLAHKRRHAGIRRHQCTVCGKRFYSNCELTEHFTTVHERSSRFPCDLCGTAYSRKGGLRRHMRVKHKKMYHEDAQTLVAGTDQDGDEDVNQDGDEDVDQDGVAATEQGGDESVEQE